MRWRGLYARAMGKSVHANARDALEAYKQARLAFVTSLNEMLKRADPSLDAALLDGECLGLLHRPLVQDILPNVQTSALAAMRLLASRVDRAGDTLATPETLTKIVSSLSHQDVSVVVAGCGVARALASKRESHVRALFDAGALPPLRNALDSLNPEIMDAAARCAVAVASASPWAAERLLDEQAADNTLDEQLQKSTAGSVLECLCAAASSPDTPLATRTHIVRIFEACCKHGEALASRVVSDCDATAVVARLARDAGGALAAGGSAPRARAAAFACAAEMAKHAVELAQSVFDSGIIRDAVFGSIEQHESYQAEALSIREASTCLLLFLVNKTPELAELVCDAGAVASLTQNLAMHNGGKHSVLAAQALGYIGDYKPSLALKCVQPDGGQRLVKTLATAETGDVAAAAAWALGCIARHGTETANQLAKHNTMQVLLTTYVGIQADRHLTLRDKAKTALKNVIKKCGGLELIDFLVSHETPGPVLKHVLSEFAERLGKDVNAKRAFVTSGGLMRLQGVLRAHEKDVKTSLAVANAAKKGEGPEKLTGSLASAAIGEVRPLLDERGLRDAKKINAVFPPDVVSYYLYC